MPSYRLNFKRHGKLIGSACFDDSTPGRALQLAHRRACPAELWADGAYVATLRQSPTGGFWMIYRESDVATSRGDAEPPRRAPASALGRAPALRLVSVDSYVRKPVRAQLRETAPNARQLQ